MGISQAPELPLKILIVDSEESAVQSLHQALKYDQGALTITAASTIAAARALLSKDGFNTVFIDPLSVGLAAAADFIFDVREGLPEIVFVLYVDRSVAEKQRFEFYKGERRRFSHYHYLDKRTPIGVFSDELRSVLARARRYLITRISQATLERLRLEAERLVESKPTDAQAQLLLEIRGLISKIAPTTWDEKKDVKKNTVFLSYRFAEEEHI